MSQMAKYQSQDYHFLKIGPNTGREPKAKGLRISGHLSPPASSELHETRVSKKQKQKAKPERSTQHHRKLSLRTLHCPLLISSRVHRAPLSPKLVRAIPWREVLNSPRLLFRWVKKCCVVFAEAQLYLYRR